MGLGKALWVFGFLQIFSNVGYVILAGFPTSPDQPPDQLQTQGGRRSEGSAVAALPGVFGMGGMCKRWVPSR